MIRLILILILYDKKITQLLGKFIASLNFLQNTVVVILIDLL